MKLDEKWIEEQMRRIKNLYRHEDPCGNKVIFKLEETIKWCEEQVGAKMERKERSMILTNDEISEIRNRMNRYVYGMADMNNAKRDLSALLDHIDALME